MLISGTGLALSVFLLEIFVPARLRVATRSLAANSRGESCSGCCHGRRRSRRVVTAAGPMRSQQQDWEIAASGGATLQALRYAAITASKMLKELEENLSSLHCPFAFLFFQIYYYSILFYIILELLFPDLFGVFYFILFLLFLSLSSSHAPPRPHPSTTIIISIIVGFIHDSTTPQSVLSVNALIIPCPCPASKIVVIPSACLVDLLVNLLPVCSTAKSRRCSSRRASNHRHLTMLPSSFF